MSGIDDKPPPSSLPPIGPGGREPSQPNGPSNTSAGASASGANKPELGALHIEFQHAPKGGTRLHDAANLAQSHDITTLVKEHGVDTADDYGASALHYAVKAKADPEKISKTIDKLVEAGAKVDLAAQGGLTSLHLAIQHGTIDAVQTLLKHNPGINHQTDKGNTALSLAVANGKLDMVLSLLAAGADTAIANNQERTPLALAFELGHRRIALEIVKKLDFQNDNLAGYDLSNALIYKKNFGAEVNLEGTNFKDAIFRHVDLSKLDPKKLAKADLEGARYDSSVQFPANFSPADHDMIEISPLDWSRVSLFGVTLPDYKPETVGFNFAGSDLAGFDISKLNLKGANLSAVNLSGQDLRRQELAENEWRERDLSEVNFSGANLIGAELPKQLEAVNFSGATLDKAKLVGANCQRANFTGASMQEVKAQRVDFTGANLTNAILDKAHFSAAQFIKAILFGASFANTIISKQTKFDNDPQLYLRAAEQIKAASKGVIDLTETREENPAYKSALERLREPANLIIVQKIYNEQLENSPNLEPLARHYSLSLHQLRQALTETKQYIDNEYEFLHPEQLNSRLLAYDGNKAISQKKILLTDAVDLSTLDHNLDGINFQGLVAPEINFGTHSLKGADFSGAYIPGAQFAGDLSQAKFNKAELNDVQLSGTNLTATEFNEANLINVLANNVTADGTIFTGAVMHAMQMQGAEIKGAKLGAAIANEIDLSKATITDTDFDKAQMNNASLNKATITRSKFVETELNKADLTRASFKDSDLSQAELCDTSLNGTEFTENSVLKGAKLLDLDAEKTDFSGADLSEAKISGFIKEANFNKAELSNVDLSKASFVDGQFEEASLIAANAKAAEFNNCNFAKALLSKAIFDEAEFIRPNFDDTKFMTERVESSRASFKSAKVFDPIFADGVSYEKDIKDQILTNTETFFGSAAIEDPELDPEDLEPWIFST